MAQHYEVRAGETLAIHGPANVVINTGSVPVVGQGEAPTVEGLDPDTAVCGDPDLQMIVDGTGFNQGSIITFNGLDEPTALLSDTQVRTNVKPSLFTVPATCPVAVRNGSQSSNSVDFTFTEAAGATRGRKR